MIVLLLVLAPSNDPFEIIRIAKKAIILAFPSFQNSRFWNLVRSKIATRNVPAAIRRLISRFSRHEFLLVASLSSIAPDHLLRFDEPRRKPCAANRFFSRPFRFYFYLSIILLYVTWIYLISTPSKRGSLHAKRKRFIALQFWAHS